MHIYAAYIFSFFTFIVVLFQLALGFGAPWGDITLGGKYSGQLPVKLRFSIIFQVIILICIALVVLVRAGLVLESYFNFSEKAILAVVIFSLLGTIMNTITPSKWERIIWMPVTLILLLTSVIVAIS